MTWLLSIGLHNAAVTAFLALLVWGLTRIWKNPPAAHLLWLLVLVKLVTPPLVILDLGSWVAESAVVAPPRVENPHSTILESPEGYPRGAELTSVANEAPSPATGDESGSAPPAQPHISIAAIWIAIRPALMWIWVGGAALVALIVRMRIVRFQRMLSGMLPASQRLQSVADDLAKRMGLQHSPDVRVVDSAVAPLVWCAGGRATVVLPVRLLGAIDEQQTAMVLAHELAHLRRRDHFGRAEIHGQRLCRSRLHRSCSTSSSPL